MIYSTSSIQTITLVDKTLESTDGLLSVVNFADPT